MHKYRPPLQPEELISDGDEAQFHDFHRSPSAPPPPPPPLPPPSRRHRHSIRGDHLQDHRRRRPERPLRLLRRGTAQGPGERRG